MPENDAETLLAAHRLTFWTVYQWNGGFEVAPRCTCGVLWSAGGKDDPSRQIASWEKHVAELLAQRDAAMRAEAWDEGFEAGKQRGFWALDERSTWPPPSNVNPYRAATDASEQPEPFSDPISIAKYGQETPVASVALTDEDQRELDEARDLTNPDPAIRDAVERIVARHVDQALSEVAGRIITAHRDAPMCDYDEASKIVSAYRAEIGGGIPGADKARIPDFPGRVPCLVCGPGYFLGDDGCRHGGTRA